MSAAEALMCSAVMMCPFGIVETQLRLLSGLCLQSEQLRAERREHGCPRDWGIWVCLSIKAAMALICSAVWMCLLCYV